MSQLLIGKIAPHFSTQAAVGSQIVKDFSLENLRGKYVVFFFYPLDFTFVCPTELHAFQDAEKEFEQRGAEVVGCSVDSPYTHHAWLQVPKSRGGIASVSYPLASDLCKTIARSYGALKEDEGIAYRALFLIDKQGIIRHQSINDLPLGRSVDEVLRLLDALIHHEKHGEVCPANWRVGEKAMKPTAEGLATYFH